MKFLLISVILCCFPQEDDSKTGYLEMPEYNLAADFSKHSEENQKHLNMYRKRGVKVIAGTEELKGQERFAADGFLKEEQCQELMKLAQVRFLFQLSVVYNLPLRVTFLPLLNISRDSW